MKFDKLVSFFFLLEAGMDMIKIQKKAFSYATTFIALYNPLPNIPPGQISEGGVWLCRDVIKLFLLQLLFTSSLGSVNSKAGG